MCHSCQGCLLPLPCPVLLGVSMAGTPSAPFPLSARRDWGIENFISPTLLRNMRGKDIKKAISYHLKRNQVLLDPRQKVVCEPWGGGSVLPPRGFSLRVTWGFSPASHTLCPHSLIPLHSVSHCTLLWAPRCSVGHVGWSMDRLRLRCWSDTQPCTAGCLHPAAACSPCL